MAKTINTEVSTTAFEKIIKNIVISGQDISALEGPFLIYEHFCRPAVVTKTDTNISQICVSATPSQLVDAIQEIVDVPEIPNGTYLLDLDNKRIILDLENQDDPLNFRRWFWWTSPPVKEFYAGHCLFLDCNLRPHFSFSTSIATALYAANRYEQAEVAPVRIAPLYFRFLGAMDGKDPMVDYNAKLFAGKLGLAIRKLGSVDSKVKVDELAAIEKNQDKEIIQQNRQEQESKASVDAAYLARYGMPPNLRPHKKYRVSNLNTDGIKEGYIENNTLYLQLSFSILASDLSTQTRNCDWVYQVFSPIPEDMIVLTFSPEDL